MAEKPYLCNSQHGNQWYCNPAIALQPVIDMARLTNSQRLSRERTGARLRTF
ncbi:MAG: hypothetical protein PUB65_04525 [Prevotellaceae bacterium]|nr:hypothetical protein [Prevotellaceae bacterium]